METHKRKHHLFKLALVVIPLIGVAKVLRYRAWQRAGGAPGSHHARWGHHHRGFSTACREKSGEPNIQHA